MAFCDYCHILWCSLIIWVIKKLYASNKHQYSRYTNSQFYLPTMTASTSHYSTWVGNSIPYRPSIDGWLFFCESRSADELLSNFLRPGLSSYMWTGFYRPQIVASIQFSELIVLPLFIYRFCLAGFYALRSFSIVILPYCECAIAPCQSFAVSEKNAEDGLTAQKLTGLATGAEYDVGTVAW